MSLTDKLGVGNDITQGEAAGDRVLAQANADASGLLGQADKSANAIEDKIIAAVQPLLAEIQIANDNISRLVAVFEKIAGGVTLTFGGTK